MKGAIRPARLFALLVLSVFFTLCSGHVLIAGEAEFYQNVATPDMTVFGQNEAHIYYFSRPASADSTNQIFKYNLATDHSEQIAETTASPYADPPRIYNGYLLYVKDYHLHQMNLATAEQTTLGALVYGKYAVGEGKVLFMEARPEDKNLVVMVQQDTGEKTDLFATEHGKWDGDPFELVGDYFYYTDYDYAADNAGNSALYRYNIRTKKRTRIFADTVRSFYYDEVAAVFYIATENQPYLPVNNEDFVMSFTEKDLTPKPIQLQDRDRPDYLYYGGKILRVGGGKIYYLFRPSFFYLVGGTTESPRILESITNFDVLCWGSTDGKQRGSISPYDLAKAKAAKESDSGAGLLNLTDEYSIRILSETLKGAYYYQGNDLYHVSYSDLTPVLIKAGEK